MKFATVYCYPHGWNENAYRYLESYQQNKPGFEHDSIIICNGFHPDDYTRYLFGALPNLRLLEHDNSGYDIGGFQRAASFLGGEYDVMIFFGSHAYFRRGGWLWRVKESFEKYGRNNLYGAAGHQGVPGIWPHIRTTGFWCSPHVINEHPMRVTHPGLRYPYEHGEHSLTSWITRDKRQRAFVVGWEGEVDVFSCNSLPGTYQQGNQWNLLFGDRMSCPPYYPGE